MTDSNLKNSVNNFFLSVSLETISQTWASRLIIFIIYAAIILTTLFYGAVHQPILAVFYLGASAIVLLWIVDALLTGVFRFNRDSLQIPLILLIVYGLIQIIPFGTLEEINGVSNISRTISQDVFLTKLTVSHLIALLVYWTAITAFVDSPKRIKNFVYLITIFGFLFAFFAILQSVLSPTKIYGIYEPKFAKPFGSFVNRHNFAAYMEMTLAIPLGMLFTGAIKADKKLLYITGIALMGIALILSGSRGGLVSFGAMIFFLLIVTRKNHGTGSIILKAVLSIGLLLTVIIGAGLIGGETSLTRVAETAVSGDITTNRLHIWGVTWEVIKNNLVFGAGIGAFPTAYTAFDSLNGLERVEQAHNDYLQVLADAGIIGLLIGLFFLYKFFQRGWQLTKLHDSTQKGIALGAFAGCFAILVHSLFDFVLHTTAISLLFLTLLGIMIVSRKHSQGEASTSRKRKRKSTNVASIEEKRILNTEQSN